MSDATTAVIDAEQLEVLAEDCQAAIIETDFLARTEHLRGRWCVGAAIVRSPQYVKTRGGQGSKGLIPELAKLLRDKLGEGGKDGWSTSEVYRCVQFAEQYPALACDEGPEGLDRLAAEEGGGKVLSWSWVKRNLLPSSGGTPRRRRKAVDREQIAAISEQAIGQTWTEESHQLVISLLG